MSLNNLIKSTLSPTNISVTFRKYSGSDTTFITFFEVIDVPKLHGDNELLKTQKTMQIDVWTKDDFTSLVAQVKQLMKDAEFSFSNGRDFYEDDTGYYHYAITYKYSVDAL